MTDGRLLQVKTPRQPAATHIELFSTKHPKPVPKTQAPLLSLWVRETEQPPPRGVALPGGPAAASAAAAVAVAATRRASIAAVVGWSVEWGAVGEWRVANERKEKSAEAKKLELG